IVQVQRGRWWLDSQGYFGAEGGPVLGNLVQIANQRSEEHTSELQSLTNLVCRLLLEKKKKENDKNKDTTKRRMTNAKHMKDNQLKCAQRKCNILRVRHKTSRDQRHWHTHTSTHQTTR